MQLETKFATTELETINEQAMIYMCACPAQVSTQIASLRKLFDYQRSCLSGPDNDELQTLVHEHIAIASEKAHQIMENCLDEILRLENWDRNTLSMPAGLRVLMEKSIDDF